MQKDSTNKILYPKIFTLLLISLINYINLNNLRKLSINYLNKLNKCYYICPRVHLKKH